MVEPHAQDDVTLAGHDPDDDVAPPAPANQSTARDGGIEPAPPAANAPANAIRRIVAAVRGVVRR
jgi:hypothetical protein